MSSDLNTSMVIPHKRTKMPVRVPLARFNPRLLTSGWRQVDWSGGMIIAFHDYQYWALRTIKGDCARCDTASRNKIFLINDRMAVSGYQLAQKQPVD